MKFRVAREVLADTVAWTARSLPPRPSVPVLAGILLEVDGSQLSVSGFDYEVSAKVTVAASVDEPGTVLVQSPGDVPLGDDPLDPAAVGGDDERADPLLGQQLEGGPDTGRGLDRGDLGTLAAEQVADLHGSSSGRVPGVCPGSRSEGNGADQRRAIPAA